MSDPNRPENVRLAIAAQPSIVASISALLRTIATHLHEAVESKDPTQLKALVDHINGNPRVWSDAILAHTPSAPATIPPSVPQMPMHAPDAGGDPLESIKAQPSLEQRIAALVYPIAEQLQKLPTSGDFGQLKGLVDKINEDPRAWSDALAAGLIGATPNPSVPEMPGYVQDAFRDHGVLQHDAEQRRQAEQQAEPPAPPERQPEDTGRLANERIAEENQEPEVVDRTDTSAGAQSDTGVQPETGAAQRAQNPQPQQEA